MSIRSKWYNDIPQEIRDTIWRVRTRLPGVGDFEHNFQPDVDVDYDELEVQMEEIPSIFSYASGILADVKTMVSLKKLKLKRARASIVQQIYDDARRNNRNPPRQKDIDDLIESSEEVTKATAELIQAERVESKVFGMVQALRMKAEVLRSLAGFKRQELSDA